MWKRCCEKRGGSLIPVPRRWGSFRKGKGCNAGGKARGGGCARSLRDAGVCQAVSMCFAGCLDDGGGTCMYACAQPCLLPGAAVQGGGDARGGWCWV